VGRYTIVRKLAAGGFGVVYLARRDDGQAVALKEFLPQGIRCRPEQAGLAVRFADPHDKVRFQEGMRAFFREADMLAAVHNDRVIPIWDVFQEYGTAYFAMPVEKGGTLQDLVRRSSQALSEVELVRMFEQAAKGVAALHTRGLLHLDIKPNNLWVRPDGNLLVLDLGASRWGDEQIRDAHLARTPGFAAPEQHGDAKGRRLTPATDVYGLAAALFACLLQHPPTPAHRRQSDNPVTITLYGRASPSLIAFLDRGLSMNPSQRPTLSTFSADLRRLPRLSATSTYWPQVETPSWPVVDLPY
jgi:serine/threonine protein kinase